MRRALLVIASASPSAARKARLSLATPRYHHHLRRARRAFDALGSEYPNNVLFIAGLPKSGTTWLEKLLASFDGFEPILVPEATREEMRVGQTETFKLPTDIVKRHKAALVVMKMHVQASSSNVKVLAESGVPYVVLYRDLRDVAVSFCHYAQATPWHPAYVRYQGLSIEQALLRFADAELDRYGKWIQTWESLPASAQRLHVRYEDLVADPLAVLKVVACHYGLPKNGGQLARIIKATRGHRSNGAASLLDLNSPMRRGVAGDWRNHFTPRVEEAFMTRVGDLLTRLGYA